MKQLTKLQEDVYAAVVAQRGTLLDGHHRRFNPVKVALAILTIVDNGEVKNHVVGFHTKGEVSLNILSWSDQQENVVLTPVAVGPNLDLRNKSVGDAVTTFNKLNTFNGYKYILSDVLVF